MGRGRAKAKQTKVARQLKYNSGGIDLERLRDELVHDDARVDGESEVASTEVDDDDPYAAYADADEDDYVDPYARYADEDDADPQRR
jgi:Protein of unknown function (DUF3073)